MGEHMLFSHAHNTLGTQCVENIPPYEGMDGITENKGSMTKLNLVDNGICRSTVSTKCPSSNESH